jgi:hypothetical protein
MMSIPIEPDPTPIDPGPIDPTPVPIGPVEVLPGGVTTVTVPQPAGVNLDLLREQAQADPVIAAADFWSLNLATNNAGEAQVVLGVTGNTTGLDLLAALNQVIAAHNPTELTRDQVRARREAEANARLEAVAQANIVADPNQTILDILITHGYGKGDIV